MKLQTKVLGWYKRNKRDLPWRRTTNPYHILVSEVMLQQTQVDRVIPYYKRWLKEFPTLAALARAPTRKVLAIWSGLGYNNRALRLQKLAQQTSKLPQTEEELRQLPGIGPYTARAILAFAFNRDVAVVDTNIRRVLIHELGLPEDISEAGLEAVALAQIPRGNSCEWHNALMDYGALHATSRKTGIKPLSTQPRFAGSTRWVRGQIVRALVKEKSIPLPELEQAFPHTRFSEVVAKLRQEGLVRQVGSRLQLG
ncbi:Fe-S cluster assembly protein HesB [Candidatus Woesearchaeota archaeon]|nr:Fe-S cluster assembly protein HesB [Candidatus Woesearchaeota archaeon]